VWIFFAVASLTATASTGPAATGPVLFGKGSLPALRHNRAEVHLLASARPAMTNYWRDPEAALHDLFGVPFCRCGRKGLHLAITDDQLTLARALVSERNVAAKGGNGTGKSWIAGALGAVYSLTHPASKALWTAPTMRQTAKLSWGELKGHLSRWQPPIPAGGTLLESEWKLGEGWYALAFTTKDVGAAEAKARAKGFHAEEQLAVLDESNNVPDSVHAAIEDTWQGAQARIWQLWNPASKYDLPAKFWERCNPAGRVTLSAERAVEWQERHRCALPGMPNRRWLEDYRKRYFGTTRWCQAVTGEFPDDSSEQVVVPRSWLERCKGLVAEPTDADWQDAAIGVDTGWGGSAETVFVVRIGRVVKRIVSYPQMKDVPACAGRLMRLADEFGGKATPLAIDVLGSGGSGVHDICRDAGYNAYAVYGGARPQGMPDEYPNLVTWAWLTLRDITQRTCDALDADNMSGVEISYLDDDVLFSQLSTRRWDVKADKRFVLEDKDALATRGLLSPDRADALAYSLVPGLVSSVTERYVGVLTAEDVGIVLPGPIADYGGDNEVWPV